MRARSKSGAHFSPMVRKKLDSDKLSHYIYSCNSLARFSSGFVAPTPGSFSIFVKRPVPTSRWRDIMLQVTADVFSGRPNPVWIIDDEAEARAVIRELVKDRSLLADAPPPQAGLGFRGLQIEPLNDELARDFDLRATSYLSAGPQVAVGRANELAERLIGLMSKAEARSAAAFAEAGALPLEAPLQSFLTTQLERAGRTSQPDTVEPPLRVLHRRSKRPNVQSPARSNSAPSTPVSGTTIRTSAPATTVTTTRATSGPIRSPSPVEAAVICTLR
jgi:hypothetical protein